MKAKQSFNGSGVKADADEIQHVLMRAVVKAVSLSLLPSTSKTGSDKWAVKHFPFRLGYWSLNHTKELN